MVRVHGQWVRRLLPALLLVGVGALVWAPSLRCGFVWDDHWFIEQNYSLRRLSDVPRYFFDYRTMATEGADEVARLFRPIRNLSYFLDYRCVGLDPRWWHAHSVLLHLLNAVLLLWVARRLLGLPAALAAAGVFVVHPVASEAVVWVKCRDDLLAGAFVLTGFGLWLRWRPDWRWWRVAALAGICLLACLSKVQSVFFPVLLVLAEWVLPSDSAGSGARKGPRIAIGAAALAAVAYVLWQHAVLRRSAQTEPLAGSYVLTVVNTMRALANDLRQMVTGGPLLADYSGFDVAQAWWDPRIAGAVLLLLSVAGVALAARRELPVFALGVAWIFAAMGPVTNLLPMMQFAADRYVYAMLPGYALAMGALFQAGGKRSPRFAAAGLALLLAVYAWGARARIPVWTSDLSLFTVTARDAAQDAARPQKNLVMALLEQGRAQEALTPAGILYDIAVKNPAGRLNDEQRAECAAILGRVHLLLNQRDAAEEFLKQAETWNPTYAVPALYRGVWAGSRGDHTVAVAHMLRARDLSPGDPEILLNLGHAYRNLGRIAEALRCYRDAAEASKGTADGYLEWAALEWGQGRLDLSREAYEKGLLRFPGHPELVRWHSECLRQLGAQRNEAQSATRP